MIQLPSEPNFSRGCSCSCRVDTGQSGHFSATGGLNQITCRLLLPLLMTAPAAAAVLSCLPNWLPVSSQLCTFSRHTRFALSAIDVQLLFIAALWFCFFCQISSSSFDKDSLHKRRAHIQLLSTDTSFFFYPQFLA